MDIKNLEFSFVKTVNDLLNNGNRVNCISSLSGSSKTILIDRICKNYQNILVLLNDIKLAKEFFIELNLIENKSNIILFANLSFESIQEKLSTIINSRSNLIISPFEILDLKIPDKKSFQNSMIQISVGLEIQYDELAEHLNLLGYSRDNYVEIPGNYSLRGSIIDFWSYNEKHPVRIELDGDLIESIRYFDEVSQRSFQNIDSVTISPLLNNSQYNFSSNIFDYLDNCLVVTSEYDLINYLNNLKQTGIENNKYSHSDNVQLDFAIEKIESIKKNVISQLEMITNKFPNSIWLLEREIWDENRQNLKLSAAPTIKSNFDLLFKTLLEYSSNDFKIVICTENKIQKDRIKELLIDLNNSFEELIYDKRLSIIEFPIKEGFISKQDKILLLTDYQIFNKPYRAYLPSDYKVKRTKSRSLSTIKKGDYVVHENYGIGKYLGLEKIDIGDVKQEAMKILYAENDLVYVNLNFLHLIKKYSSDDNLAPTLSKLGTNEWSNKKARAKKKIKEAARELIELYAKRKSTKGFSFSPDTVWQKEFEASFIYEDTPDQSKATEEIKKDMESDNPMDRLICGDVGFGKTEVAIRAAFKAVQDSKQVAILVPTTILAEQHYFTFKDRLSSFPVEVQVLSRFQTKKQQKEIVKKIANGEIDIIIGTHRLLSNDIQFHDLGLLIIDEEHRFGVSAKEKLKQIKINVDTLTLTATPIPRTLNLSLLGARDLSIIATPPPNRQPIDTLISSFDINKIREWILFEIHRGGQVFFVHDRIETIDKISDYLKKHIPEIRIAVAHGKLPSTKLENVIHKFINKEYDLLLSTKIIESGIDIPIVNTIIVNHAERFGLAELHQLRGRVGRSNRQAYAYFLVPNTDGLTKKALKRLQSIEENSEIGAGFNLSMRDLEIRGAGNLLGKEQSGFIEEIGFDLYIKLINEAVEELKLSEFQDIFKSLPKSIEKSDTKIETYFEFGIPESYIPEQSDRLYFYTNLFSADVIDNIEEIKNEMIDRFGQIPIIVSRLISIALLKHYASYALFERIIIKKNLISIILPPAENEEFYKLKFLLLMKLIVNEYNNTIKFVQRENTMKLEIINNFNSIENLIEFLISFTIKVKEIIM